MRSKYGTYPEYHTSEDNLDLITPKGLEESFDIYKQVIKVIENNFYPITAFPCEPQLSKHGLYPDLSMKGRKKHVKNMMNLLAYSDGSLDIIELFEKVGVSYDAGLNIINILLEKKILVNADV